MMDDETGTGGTYYRCYLCGYVVPPWRIEAGDGCGKCGGRRVRPTSLGLLERAWLIIRHPRHVFRAARGDA